MFMNEAPKVCKIPIPSCSHYELWKGAVLLKETLGECVGKGAHRIGIQALGKKSGRSASRRN